MIVEEKLPKGTGRVAAMMNEKGLKLHQVDIVDWNPEWVIVYWDTDDCKATAGALAGTFQRGPGRPPKEAA